MSNRPTDEALKPSFDHLSLRFLALALPSVSPLSLREFPMPSELELLIGVGNDITSTKYYGLATGALLFYDYFLTLADEIEYFWSGTKSWTFWLFVANRYFPITYQVWQLMVSYGPQSQWKTKICEKTAWYSLFTFTVCAFLAQVALTLRIYAVTRKSIPITVWFAVITASELAIGIWLTVHAAMGGALTLPPIPFDAYNLCAFPRHRALEIASAGVALLYDFLAFSLTIFLATTSRSSRFKMPSILETIAEDATRYFLVIFTSHFVLEMTLNLGRESIQLLPGVGNVVYLPVMIARIMISLRKAAGAQQGGWSLGEPISSDSCFQKPFRPRRDQNGGQDDIPLDTLLEQDEATRCQ